MNIKQIVSHNLLNIPGWNTKRHIIVVESDDWGAIRMPSKRVYDSLIDAGYDLRNNQYERNDSLATEDDLNALFEVLLKYKDCHGNHPIITANCVVANPNFEKIKSSNYSTYYREPITETMQRYKGCENSFRLWKEGIQEGIFFPQCHGREHLNVARWMHVLQSGDNDNLLAFEKGMMGIPPKNNPKIGNVFQVALDDSKYKGERLEKILSEALDEFVHLFGFHSRTFIAPCYTWRPSLEKILSEKGVIGIQGMVYQHNPGQKVIRHWQGSRNCLGQVYTIRNCFFEPTIRNISKDVAECLYRIECAFRWHKPAVISAHRVNFIGAIREENRTKNLKDFDSLLSTILKKWPDVEFLNSEQLVNEILLTK